MLSALRRFNVRSMYPKPIERYFAPRDLAEALRLRAEYAAEGALIAGGQSLLPRMKARVVSHRTLIDLNHLENLAAIESVVDCVRIGALVRHRGAAADPRLRQTASVLSDAAQAIGDLQVRNRGTVIGSLCEGEPASDIAPAAIALGAHLRLKHTVGERLVPVTALRSGVIDPCEVATHLEFCTPIPGTFSAYLKIGRAAQDRPIIGVAALVVFDHAGRSTRAVIVVGGVHPAPQLALHAAATLKDALLTLPLLATAGEVAAAEVATQDDTMASAQYRSQLIRSLVPEVLARVLARHRKEAR